MKDRLKQATKLRKEALRHMKIASALEFIGDPARAAEFHVGAIVDGVDADDLMYNVPACQIVSGEVVPTEAERDDGNGGWAMRDTLASPDTAALAASMERTELLSQTYTDVLALGIDAAQSTGSDNSLYKMLAHEMALAHKTSFKLIDDAMHQREPVEQARLVNAAARLMSVYQQGLLVLNRIKTGGNQTVTVQHVQISGGQAVVAGNIKTGGLPATKSGGGQ